MFGAQPLPPPIFHYFTLWNSDPFTLASYSAIAVGKIKAFFFKGLFGTTL
jgi:hypothetical protein